jgi:hypothetical protein
MFDDSFFKCNVLEYSIAHFYHFVKGVWHYSSLKLIIFGLIIYF